MSVVSDNKLISNYISYKEFIIIDSYNSESGLLHGLILMVGQPALIYFMPSG